MLVAFGFHGRERLAVVRFKIGGGGYGARLKSRASEDANVLGMVGSADSHPQSSRSIRCAIPPSLIGQGWSDHCYPDGGAAVPDTGAHIWPAGSFDHECRNAVPCPRERPRCVF